MFLALIQHKVSRFAFINTSFSDLGVLLSRVEDGEKKEKDVLFEILVSVMLFSSCYHHIHCHDCRKEIVAQTYFLG